MKNKKIPEELIKIAEDLKYLKDYYGIATSFFSNRTGPTGPSGFDSIHIYSGATLDSIRKQINEYLAATSPHSQLAILQGLMDQTIQPCKKNTCMAVASGGQIQFVVQKGEEAYDAFSKILIDINQQKGVLTWYGDIEDKNGKEQSGLIITSSDSTKKKILSIVEREMELIENEIVTLLTTCHTYSDRKFSGNQFYDKKIGVFTSQDTEDRRIQIIETMFCLSKINKEITEYFNQKP